MRFYCACLPDSLFIYCLDRRLPSRSKCKTRYTPKTMTLNIPKPEPLLRGALQLLCGGSTRAPLAPQSPMRAKEPRTGGVLQPNDPASATLDPRPATSLASVRSAKSMSQSKPGVGPLSTTLRTLHGRVRLLTFAVFHRLYNCFPILHLVCGLRLSSIRVVCHVWAPLSITQPVGRDGRMDCEARQA